MARAYNVRLREPRDGAVRWALGQPLRLYLRHMPLRRGKGPVQRLLTSAFMPRNARLRVQLPCGDVITMTSNERIGRYLLIHERFEDAELAACARFARPGATVMDVGANVGIFTMTLARLVGVLGSVIAVDPLRSNCERLELHARENGHTNVRIMRLAAGAKPGHAIIDAALDPAFVSTSAERAQPTGAAATPVSVVPLDELWSSFGRPDVAFVKIDVEGSELDVLDGATQMLSQTRPTLLLEVADPAGMPAVHTRLGPLGYKASQLPGFEPWNYVFSADGSVRTS